LPGQDLGHLVDAYQLAIRLIKPKKIFI
jgi:hypothetical protein